MVVVSRSLGLVSNKGGIRSVSESPPLEELAETHYEIENYIIMAYTAVVYIVMACIAMAYIVVAYVVMAI